MVLNFIDGQILTAGSLQLIPQFYDVKNNIAPTFTSGAAGTWFDGGSIHISGNIFRDKLLVSYFMGTLQATAAAGSISVRLITSGAGLGGGSAIFTHNNSGFFVTNGGTPTSNTSNFVSIGSNQGWIPGSDVVIRFQNTGNVDLSSNCKDRGYIVVFGQG